MYHMPNNRQFLRVPPFPFPAPSLWILVPPLLAIRCEGARLDVRPRTSTTVVFHVRVGLSELPGPKGQIIQSLVYSVGLVF